MFNVLTPVELTCEYHINPIGLGVRQPRPSWKLAGGARRAHQTAYQVRVAGSPESLAAGEAICDSAKVPSGQCLHIPYAGPALRSSQRC